MKDSLIEVRTSSLPAEYGESIVMRILNPKNLISLDDLGLREDLYKTFQKEIENKCVKSSLFFIWWRVVKRSHERVVEREREKIHL